MGRITFRMETFADKGDYDKIQLILSIGDEIMDEE
jgi:hypothetical protein